MLTVYDVMPVQFREALNDPTVTDIAIRDNGHGYITKLGEKIDIGHCADKVELMLCLAAHDAGCVINSDSPSIECRLSNGQRLVGKRPEVGNAWTVTIRDPMGKRLSWRDMIALKTVTEKQAEWIEDRVASGDSGIVAGSMGSGKTNLLNTMLGSTSLSNKVTIKLEAEVEELIGPPLCTTYIIGQHCTTATARKRGLRESGELFIFGEARDGEEMREVMTTMGTGHQSFTTLHADSINDVPHRIENMLRQTVDTRTQQQIHEDIVRNVDFCIYMRGMGNGRKVVEDIAAFEMQGGVAVRKHIDI